MSLTALLDRDGSANASQTSLGGTSTGLSAGGSSSFSQFTTGTGLTGTGVTGTSSSIQSSDDGTGGGLCVEDTSRTDDVSIARAAQVFDVTIDGAVESDSISNLDAILIVRPTEDTDGVVEFDNELNVRDVGLFSGNPAEPEEAGEIAFATNTAIDNPRTGDTDAPESLSAVDVAFVNADADTDVLTVTVDPEFAASREVGEFYSFAAPAEASEEALEITAGTLTLEFAGEGETVFGNIVFRGSGSAQTETVSYSAQITGTRRSS